MMHEKINIIEQLGVAEYYDLFLVKMKYSEETYTGIKLKLNGYLKDEEKDLRLKLFQNFYNIGRSLGEQNGNCFLKTIDFKYDSDQDEYWIVTEEFGVSLTNFLKNIGNFSWELSLSYLIGPLCALYSLHIKDFIHGNFTPHSLYVSKTNLQQVLLTDLLFVQHKDSFQLNNILKKKHSPFTFPKTRIDNGLDFEKYKLFDLYSWFITWYTLSKNEKQIINELKHFPPWKVQNGSFFEFILANLPPPIASLFITLICDEYPSVAKILLELKRSFPHVINNSSYLTLIKTII